ncbi:MAG: hypothetical protein R3D61_04590 [Defluviimonas denitrificans]
MAGLLDAARPIIVGGTGLYPTALTEGLAEIPPVPAAIRAEADGRLAGRSGRDDRGATSRRPPGPTCATRPRPARLEVARATGRGPAARQADTGAPLLLIERAHPILLWPDRETGWWIGSTPALTGCLEGGALRSVRAVLADQSVSKHKAIGAPELIAHLKGDLPLDEASLSGYRRPAANMPNASAHVCRRMRDWATIALP